MRKLSLPVILVCLLAFVLPAVASAQSASQLDLGLSRDFGYGGFGDDIQGLFTIRVKNPPADLVRVVFLLDGEPMGEDSSAPFSLQFSTDSYPLGNHTLSALGTTSNQAEITSETIQVEFVPASAGTDAVGKIILPIIGLIVLMAAISLLIPLIQNKGKLSSLPLGAPRRYGIGGGTVCPRCSRPFPLRLWFINLGFNKIDRCPYCGKWAFVRRHSESELRAAEAAELVNVQPGNLPAAGSDTDKLKKDLDDSRFQDL